MSIVGSTQENLISSIEDVIKEAINTDGLIEAMLAR